MTVNEYIDTQKEKLTKEEVIDGLIALIEYSSYVCSAPNFNEEYGDSGADYKSIDEDPWITDVIICEAAIRMLEGTK